SWYAEGTTASYQQAEVEYKDFITFFPQLPEAAEAQLKIANMHYKQMEKPDRDYTHAMRAEDEYRQLMQQFPDSTLVAEAKQRLKELGLPVPTPTPEAIAQYKAEEQSRSELGRFRTMMSTFHKAPDDLARAAKVGEPTLIEPQQTSAPQLIHEANNAALGI